MASLACSTRPTKCPTEINERPCDEMPTALSIAAVSPE
jgi:hypothetical protein